MNELGAGFLEKVYENALTKLLRDGGLAVQQQTCIDVHFRGQTIGQYQADLLVERKVLVELKAVKNLLPEHQAQTINYLKATGKPVGLLINFGNPKLHIKRMNWAEKNPALS
jgi:GxxExxY protein